MVVNRYLVVLGLLLIAKGVIQELQGGACMCSRQSVCFLYRRVVLSALKMLQDSAWTQVSMLLMTRAHCCLPSGTVW